MLFNNLEYITIEKQSSAFPKHFHETFCFSLIHKGVEQIDFENQSVFTEAGCISIANPYEIHSNPLIDNYSHLKFDTIYIPIEIIKYLLKGENIRFVNRKINCKKTNALFLALKSALDTKNVKLIEFHLTQFINALKFYSEKIEADYSALSFNNFNQLNTYIEEHIQDKFSLNELSKMTNMNKFGFSKKFKNTTGMTPMNYILMRKIFHSKNLITPSVELTKIAYDYEFADLAHYSKTFKRFIGLSPKTYQKKQ